MFLYFVFFFKQKTAYEMRISDWSSDVCSSDLCVELGVDVVDHGDEIDDEIIEKMVEAGTFWVPSLVYVWSLLELGMGKRFGASPEIYEHVRKMQIGRASCRERVCQYV